MNKAIIIPPNKISPLFEMHIDSLVDLFLQDPVGNKLRSSGIGWIVCKETYRLHNVLPSSPSIAFVMSGEKQLHYDGRMECCPRGGMVLFPAGVPICVSNVSFAQNGKNSGNKNLGYLALCASFTQEAINTVSHLLVNNALSAQKWHLPTSPTVLTSATASVVSEPELDTTFSDLPPSSDGFCPDKFLLTILESLNLMCNFLSSRENGLATNIFATRMLENLLLLIASYDFGSIMLNGVTGLDVLPLRLREIVRKQLAYPWKLAELALDLHMTERTLRRHLEKSGNGLRELLRSERLHAGLVMLQQTHDSVESIAFECGYSSASRFSRRFQELFGVLPHQMRKARGDWGVTLSV